MTTSRTSWIRWVFLGLGGLVIVAAGAVGGILLLRGHAEPARLLPALQTIAYAHHADRVTLERYAPESIANMPVAREPFDVAFLAGGGWVLFPEAEGDPLLRQVTGTIGGRSFIASSGEVAGLVGRGPDRLADDASYRALLQGNEPGGASLFLRLQMDRLSDGPVAQLLFEGNPQTALLSWHADKTVIRLLDTVPAVSGSGPVPGLPALDPPATRALALQAPEGNIGGGLFFPPAMDDALRASLLTAALSRILGTDVSWQFDILPLLEQPATLSWAPASGSGTPLFVLEGSDTDGNLAARLERLRTSARTAMASAGTVRRDFEEGVTITQISGAPEAIQDSHDTRGGWDISAVIVGDTAFITAKNGRQFLVSNMPAWVEQMTETDAQSTEFGGSAVRAAGKIGETDMPQSGILEGILSPGAVWTIETWGNIRQMTVRCSTCST